MDTGREQGPLAALEVVEAPTDADRQSILEVLVAYNRAEGPPTKAVALAIVIRNKAGVIEGGLWGHSIYDWLRIELVVVPESARGHGVGRALMVKAEAVAQERGCVGAWLDTFSFQARGFYEKLGYRLSGTIEDHPLGGARYILSRRFG